MKSLYAVVCENGEYSDRFVWVGGIYENEADARTAMELALVRRREWDNWHNVFLNELYRANPKRGIYTKAQIAGAEANCPPKPPYEGTERAEIVSLEIGVWQAFHGEQ